MWEEIWAPRENPHKQGERMNSSKKGFDIKFFHFAVRQMRCPLQQCAAFLGQIFWWEKMITDV